MRTLWPTPATDPASPDLVANRQAFAEKYNAAVVALSPTDAEYQARFVAGEVTYDEAVSYFRYCSYMIAASCAEIKLRER